MNRIYLAAATLALGLALAVAGCGGSSGSSGESGYSYGSSEESTAASKTASEANASGAGAATLAVKNLGGDVGSVLVDAEGLTLYYFEKDKGGKSACSGACASAWPPLTTEGAPQGTGGVLAAKLGTTRRSDGASQVTYAGWPLYTYVGDKAPGEDNGTDLKSYGASWYPLHPNGEKAGD
ncbi:MAG: hypothetical protein ACM3N0_12530 [Chloroflexota bacterium]